MFSFLKKFFQSTQPKVQSIKKNYMPKMPKELSEYEITIKNRLDVALLEFSEQVDEPIKQLKKACKLVIYESILEQGKIIIPDEMKDRFYKALVESEWLSYQELNAIFLIHDFKWHMFDECRRACEESKIYPYAYQFLKNKPKIPEDFENALLFVRVAQLRAMLKSKLSEKIPTRKNEVYQLFAQHFQLEDMKEILEERLVEVIEQFEYSMKWQKIQIFIHWFNQFVDNLYEWFCHRILDVENVRGRWELPLFLQNHQDKEFLNFIEIDAQSCIDSQGRIVRLPPLFPGDYSKIYYDSP